MNSKKFQDWLQIGGLFGVIISLVFVGMQTMLAQDIALSAAYQSRADSSMALKMAPLNSQTLLSALSKNRTGQSDALTDEEYTASIYFFSSQMIYLENELYQCRKGFISEEQWRTNVADLKFLLSIDINRDAWHKSQSRWTRSFNLAIAKVLADIESESPGKLSLRCTELP